MWKGCASCSGRNCKRVHVLKSPLHLHVLVLKTVSLKDVMQMGTFSQSIPTLHYAPSGMEASTAQALFLDHVNPLSQLATGIHLLNLLVSGCHGSMSSAYMHSRWQNREVKWLLERPRIFLKIQVGDFSIPPALSLDLFLSPADSRHAQLPILLMGE